MKLNADLTGFTISEDGLTITNPRGKVLKQNVGTKGYLTFNVSAKDNGGKRATVSVHRFVAFTYIANPDGKPQVNHIDGDKLNNCVSNLEWCTNKENSNHAIETGLIVNKVQVKGVHTKTGEVIYFSSMRANEGFSNGHISECCSGKRKTHKGFKWEKI